MMNLIKIVAKKECMDGFRDRRAFVSAFLFPLFGPIFLALMFTSIASEKNTETALPTPVSGAEHAPNLMAHLRANDIDIVDAPADPEEAVAMGEEDFVLVIGPDYPKRFREAKPAPITLIVDESKMASKQKSRRLEATIEAYSSKMSAMRLIARGVSPQAVQPISIVTKNLATPQTQGANLFEVIVMFSVMAAFLCNMYIAIDATAGERERGSLEPLLINPASRTALVCGKWLATILYGLTGVLFSLTCTAISMQNVPLEDLGLRFVFGWQETLILFVAFSPLVLLAGALQLLLASYAKTFKEAQTYLSIVLFLPMLPGMILMLKPMNPALWMSSIPAMSQQMIASSVLRGDGIDMTFILISAASCITLSIICLALTIKLYGSEKIFFKS